MTQTPSAAIAFLTYVAFPNGRNIPLSWREEREDEFQALLRETYLLEKPAYCLCRRQVENERRLAVRQLGPTDKHWYVLAKYPLSGSQHDPRCEWYEAPFSASGRSIYEDGVIKQREDGTLGIRLSESLEAMRQRRSSDGIVHHNGGGYRQAEMTLRGLLDLLWEQGGLDTWRPQFAGKRSWYTVANMMQRVTPQIIVGGKRLDDRFAVIIPGATDNVITRVHEAWDAAVTEKRGLLVLGQLSTLDEPALGKTTERIGLKAAWGAYKIGIRAEAALITQLRSRWARDLQAFAVDQARDRVIALLHVRPRETQNERFGFVVAGALMRTTDLFIPVASGYESQVAHLLVDQGRHFRKPLRYDGEGLFPDFELLDTPNVVPMEVFGRNDPAYLSRRDEKIRLYERLYGSSWWSWDASTSRQIPAFPAAQSRHQPEYRPTIRI